MKPIIIIPARMGSTRLPDKPLADIGGLPMIVRVAQLAAQSKLGEVVIACDGAAIADVAEKAGFKAVITDPALPSGSDRIFAALESIDHKGDYDTVINVQGDLPTLDPSILAKALALLENPEVDIATLAAVITDTHERTDPAVVKAILSGSRALYFTRATAPSGEGLLYHHIGLYAYRRAALARFVALPPSPLEQREKLEQLRALEAGMRIDVAIVDVVPLGVDTPETLEKARKHYE
jgi:3-deoxy-manno-octulosonate cytidylyltransferase (CMP-KDO synthetase)